MLAVALVALTLRLGPNDVSRAVEPAPSTSLAAGSASSTSPDPTSAATRTLASGRASTAPAKKKTQKVRASRTALQRATGLHADGSVAAIPRRGSGKFTEAKQARKTSAKSGRRLRFDVAVERGLAVDPDQAALLIASVLEDDRSWRSSGNWRFELVPRGRPADLHALIATPGTTDRLCAPFLTRGKVSCQNGQRVVLNAERWVRGAEAYGKDTTSYRRYLVNHEFGHALGRQHVRCPGRGKLAPVMMQQTKGLDGCRANPWPSRTRG